MNSALLGAWVSTLPAISFSASLSPCAQQVPISVRRAYSTECGFTPKCFAVSGYNRFVISWILSPEFTTCSIMYIYCIVETGVSTGRPKTSEDSVNGDWNLLFIYDTEKQEKEENGSAKTGREACAELLLGF